MKLSCEVDISEDEKFKSLKSLKKINYLEIKNSLNALGMKS